MLVKEINEKELDELIERLKEAITNKLSLTERDMTLVLNMLLSLAYLNEKLADNDITLHKLKKLAGLVKASEKLKDIVPSVVPKKEKPKKARKGKKEKIVNEISHHKLEGFSKGQVCPKCEIGKLYKYKPGEFIRIKGQEPFVSSQHFFEKFRCNGCLAYFTADAPPEVKEDGDLNQKYGYSARSIMAIYKYFGGLPFHRQESLNRLFGRPVSSSTIFDQCEYVSNAVLPVFNHLKKLAADSLHYCIDDTTNRILDVDKKMIPDRKTGKLKERSGIYTSGMIAFLDAGFDSNGYKNPDNKIILFKTNIGHAGEFLDEILKNRNAHAPPPVIMSDALKSNMPTVIKKYHRSLCNAHARREFYDLHKQFPDKVEWVLKEYAKIWEINGKGDWIIPGQRLDEHKFNSLPVMERIRDWGITQLETKTVEENSGLGKAIKYFLNNYQGLSAFCRIDGAMLDNNEMESTLKLIIRIRKNSLFLKSEIGAGIADILTSIISTCEKLGLSSFFYLNDIQKYAHKVKENPEKWLPWNYYQTKTQIENEKKC